MGNKCSTICKLPEDEWIKLLEDTRLKEEVLVEWYKEFRKRFPDGSACRQEFHAVFRQSLAVSESSYIDSLLDIIFDFLDPEDQDEITFSTLAVFVSVPLIGSCEQKINWVFNIISKGQEKFSFEQLKLVSDAVCRMRGLPSSNHQVLKEMFVTMSSDAQFVSRQEFQNGMICNKIKMRDIVGYHDQLIFAPVRLID